MITHDIGTTAGRVWQKLHDEGEMSISALKKTLGSKDALVDWAIGWLAREDKISIRKGKNVFEISLKEE